MKRTKRWPMLAALALLGTALVCGRTASAAEPSEADMYQKWETISVEDLKVACSMGTHVPDGRYRLIGEVKSVSTPNPALGSYYFIQGSEGERFPVKNTGNRMMSEDMVFLAATLQTASDGTLYLNEAFVWRFYSHADAQALGFTTPTTEDLRGWRATGGYDYAVENAFRRFFIKNQRGATLSEISIGNWTDRGVRTTVSEIEKFLHPDGPLCPKCHKNPCVCPPPPPPPPTCPKCGHLQSECICPPPVPPWLQWVKDNAALLLLALVVIGAVAVWALTRKTVPPPPPPCPKCGHFPCICKQPPPEEKTVVLVGGAELDTSDKTVALSDYALKVVKGGKSVGQLLLLTAGEAILGRGTSASGTFIHLDMSDRPDLAKHCSREYAKITPQYGTDKLDVEVVNTSHNKVVVDGRVLLNKGDVAQAKVGSHIVLNPDWEFEVVNR